MKSSPKVVSLFAGCGGMDLGFTEAGFEVVWANDINKYACESYAKNIGSHIVCEDLYKIDTKEIPSCDVVIGGFPCQGFSIVGTRRLDDSRNFLYKEMKRVIKDKNPSFFVAENVRGLLNIAKGKVIEAIVEEFKEMNYTVDYALLNAKDYGVPQLRERVIIVGHREDLSFSFPKKSHFDQDFVPIEDMFNGTDVMQIRTLRDAISDLVDLDSKVPNHTLDDSWKRKHPTWEKVMSHIGEGQKLCNVRLGERSVYTWDIPEVYGKTTKKEKHVLLTIAGNRRHKKYGPKDGNPLTLENVQDLMSPSFGDLHNTLEKLVNKGFLIHEDGGYQIKNAFNGIFRRLRWDTPSEAILTVFDSPRYYLHPSRNSQFTVRETARIQSFNDDFVFCGPIKEQHIQTGNAVPPLLAKAVATKVLEELNG